MIGVLNYLYFMDFLYFPEDKTEYIPAVIALAVFFTGAAVAMYLIVKKSKKDVKKFEEEYLENTSNYQQESSNHQQ